MSGVDFREITIGTKGAIIDSEWKVQFRHFVEFRKREN
jgi:hypothetical protein